VKGDPDFPALFKKTRDSIKKEVFSAKSKEQHQNLKRTEIIAYKRTALSSMPRSSH